MRKNKEKLTNKTQYKSQGKTFFLLAIISIGLFLMLNFISASNFAYNSQQAGVTIGGNKTTYINNSYYNVTSGGVTNVSSITCAGTNKFSAYDNATGLFTCSADDTGTGLSSAIINTTFNQYLNSGTNASYLTTSNSTYDSYATNVSTNWTLVTFNAYNTTWDDTGTGDNESWNASYADTLYTNKTGYNATQFQTIAGMIHIIDSWITGLIESIGIALGFNNTFNSTYDSYATNVSTNWTLDTYTNWNGDWLSTYNATYESYSTNVSKNWTKITFDAYNTTWDDTGVGENVNASILEYLNTGTNASYLSTYNSTYHALIGNESYLSTYNATYHTWAFNQTLNIDQTYWFNQTANLVLTSENVNASILEYLNTGTNASYLTTYNSTYHTLIGNTSYLSTYNSTYESYQSNVSRNYTLDTYTNWNQDWLGGNNSLNDSYLFGLFAPNTTAGIQYLINNTGVYSTYNSTYESYGNNVSRNWTLDTYTNWNNDWTATYNSTYDSYATNVSLNYTKIVFDAYNVTWSSYPIGGGDNASWNASYADTLYTNKTGYNVTQFETIAGMIHIIDSWITGLIESIGIALGFNNTYNSTYESYKTNVSTNWTLVTFDTYNTTWDDVIAGENVNASINEYLTRANASYLTTSNASYDAFNTTVNIQVLYNLTASLIANFSINDFLNKTINIYFTGANSSQSTNINFSINDFLNKTINQYLTLANTSYLSTYNATYHALIGNTSYLSTYNATYHALIGNTSYLSTYNSTYHNSNLSNYNLALAVNNTAKLVYTVNTTGNVQNLINNTNLNFTSLTLYRNMSMSSNQSIAVNGKSVTSNDTCIIIKGKVSTLWVC